MGMRIRGGGCQSARGACLGEIEGIDGDFVSYRFEMLPQRLARKPARFGKPGLRSINVLGIVG